VTAIAAFGPPIYPDPKAAHAFGERRGTRVAGTMAGSRGRLDVVQ